ncbi:insulin-like growth factor-binding protein-related protein 1 [Lingula anatina]|uniref:Insulin-like growth factor-binding protein-related protein 1 n=1 Tax=Lingula anatina TaxID=7574 RepID=A0A1S3GZT2_LINAN|nr:insulin-like growth factor-binding protein-related protein 1 [Lingula anatina]|eukprot:XP_013378741.1 insulin-like growth factor-binding protein-related protein 1 [Lingula anatina]
MANIGQYLGLFSALLVLAFAQKPTREQIPDDCPICDLNRCPKETDLSTCEAGLVKDRCHCCKVCGRKAGELCDIFGVTRPDIYFGHCGDNLKCVLRDDISPDAPKEAICMCMEGNEHVCGSDGETYKTMCDLSAAKKQTGKDIKVFRKGPCKSAPRIDSPPSHTLGKLHKNVVLACEVSGFPVPTVEWTWKRVDNKTFVLPRNDHKISISSRGGPEKYQVTGWVQIMELAKHHEGDYSCVAQNKYGVVQQAARVKVDTKDEEL